MSEKKKMVNVELVRSEGSKVTLKFRDDKRKDEFLVTLYSELFKTEPLGKLIHVLDRAIYGDGGLCLGCDEFRDFVDSFSPMEYVRISFDTNGIVGKNPLASVKVKSCIIIVEHDAGLTLAQLNAIMNYVCGEGFHDQYDRFENVMCVDFMGDVPKGTQRVHLLFVRDEGV